MPHLSFGGAATRAGSGVRRKTMAGIGLRGPVMAMARMTMTRMTMTTMTMMTMTMTMMTPMPHRSHRRCGCHN